ncbi:4449_t:CDS:1 [Entrophospora sp. SA101]|nr:2567_t:CDS:1 [Entrophospora sp. SA101]CAJ0832884.1 4449_t:CDS:1 [Entrophospora sp. SA101]CAJ0864921.1 3931_t:CDS:1 [Entrophospora sp. SA101]
MRIRELFRDSRSKLVFHSIGLLMATYSLFTDLFFLSSLLRSNNTPCTTLKNELLPWYESNIAHWNASDLGTGITNPPDMNTSVYFMNHLKINYGSYTGFFQKNGSYAGVVGTATRRNTSFPLVTLVSAVYDYSYLIISQGDKSPELVCKDFISDCFLDKTINFPFTSLDFGPVKTFDSLATSISPNLQMYICQYKDNSTLSYKWAQNLAKAAIICIGVLELLKIPILIISPAFLYRLKQPGILNFANNSPFLILLIAKDRRVYRCIREAMELEETNSLQLLGDTFLHSLPMLVLTVQSLVFQSNVANSIIPPLTILSLVGSCAGLCFSLFRIYVALMTIIPNQTQKLNEEISSYCQKHPEQRWHLPITFATIDSVFSFLPIIFMITLVIQGFNSVFIFIIPLLVITAKLLICASPFWTPRFRKPLTSPLVFSFTLNSPILPLLCILSSSFRRFVVITATSGVTFWSGWSLDFVSVDLPILVALIVMRAFGYGNHQDVVLLQQNSVLVILISFYLMWKIVSGLWYICISLSVRARGKGYARSTQNFTFFHVRPTFGIFIYTIIKLSIWAIGLRAFLSMVFMSPPNSTAFVVVSPKILMVFGLVIYFYFDIIGSLALLISYYGPFSTRTIALYLNSPIIVFLYILLGSNFRNQIIAAAENHTHAMLLWKLRDAVLLSSLLLIWPGFGFGYNNSDGTYAWWSWYGWGFDVIPGQKRDDSEWNLSFCGIFATVCGMIYCTSSILFNSVPIDELDELFNT